MADLSKRLAELAATGDLEAVRVAHRALAELLGDESSAVSPAVVDLAKERAKRGK